MPRFCLCFWSRFLKMKTSPVSRLMARMIQGDPMTSLPNVALRPSFPRGKTQRHGAPHQQEPSPEMKLYELADISGGLSGDDGVVIIDEAALSENALHQAAGPASDSTRFRPSDHRSSCPDRRPQSLHSPRNPPHAPCRVRKPFKDCSTPNRWNCATESCQGDDFAFVPLANLFE